ncbi:hypothetical protein Vadar_013693 [Vaccinium darrowii]|uniref:Uncharacterized protein n=1 Tax=Vaccinium darrowii TaxID=229202 RepID=A0ACB7X0J7_9ERIC|nr:hypothetical protein Vadar_013693 [Vaccinium darrowii]
MQKGQWRSVTFVGIESCEDSGKRVVEIFRLLSLAVGCGSLFLGCDIELTNMQLKPEALNALKLPVKVKAGVLGSGKVKLSLTPISLVSLLFLKRLFGMKYVEQWIPNPTIFSSHKTLFTILWIVASVFVFQCNVVNDLSFFWRPAWPSTASLPRLQAVIFNLTDFNGTLSISRWRIYGAGRRCLVHREKGLPTPMLDREG